MHLPEENLLVHESEFYTGEKLGMVGAAAVWRSAFD